MFVKSKLIPALAMRNRAPLATRFLGYQIFLTEQY